MNGGKLFMRTGLLASAMAFCATWSGVAPLRAQEVVQALPPREAGQLNAALRTLAARPADLDALLAAGNASLALRDPNAAAGFFARAARVASGDARVLLGAARVALAQRRPVEALQAFSRAEAAGVRPLDMAADRALAYDLVGDNAAAQALYKSVLGVGDSAEVRRRLALSYAIAGNRPEFERTLYPLLRDDDRSAFRTRAFGLAILGLPDDAVEIADAMMPTDLALRMAPYLRYMPRLTKAQQAAAGNLGAFPAASEIGRDSADVAGYAGAGVRIAANASASLTPTGAPLGQRPQAPGASTVSATRGRSDPAAASAPALTPAPAAARPTAGQAQPVIVAQAQPAATAPAPVVVAASLATASHAPATASPPAASPASAPARPSLDDAFADLVAATPSSGPAVGAVDIAKLAPVRKVAAALTPAPAAKPPAVKPAAKPKPEVKKPAKPAEPAREWVQIGVGRNTAAFAFDWKKLAKQAGGALDGKGPWAVKYGATNRMLAGPFATDAAVKAAIKRLKDKNITALPFSSGEGEKVTKIG